MKLTTDWVGSNPVFYNTETKAFGSSIHDAIDYSNVELDPDGLHDYFDFGYSVFGNTPVKNVKFLEPHSTLTISDTEISVKENTDPVLEYLDKWSTPEEVLDKIKTSVLQWQRKDEKQVVIPTSAGYDSRLLNYMVEDKPTVHTYGYGVTPDQKDCMEVTYATALSQLLGTKYEHIPLGDFHQDCAHWYDMYGPSLHFHGMYHIEFYKRIREKLGDNVKILSGIIGDLWAGKVTPEVRSPQDIIHLGLPHAQFDPAIITSKCVLSRTKDTKGEYFEKHKELLENPKYRIVALVRLKMMLLRYLVEVPQSVGFDCWSPFLDLDIAMSMVNLPPQLRHNRQWQQDFFRSVGIMLEDMGISYGNGNDLDMLGRRKNAFPCLNESSLGKYFDPQLLKAINSDTTSAITYYMNVMMLPLQRVLESNDCN
jgi:hypothetical protein